MGPKFGYGKWDAKVQNPQKQAEEEEVFGRILQTPKGRVALLGAERGDPVLVAAG